MSQLIDRSPVTREEVLQSSKAIHDQIIDEIKDLIRISRVEMLDEIKSLVTSLGSLKLEVPKRVISKSIVYDEFNRPITVVESEV